MRISEDNRNLVLLATVALCCAMVAGTAALVDPAEAPLRTQRVADSGAVAPIGQASVQRASVEQASAEQSSVRVIGPPFVPNVNPRQR